MQLHRTAFENLEGWQKHFLFSPNPSVLWFYIAVLQMKALLVFVAFLSKEREEIQRVPRVAGGGALRPLMNCIDKARGKSCPLILFVCCDELRSSIL